ncbi:MAG TPA: NHL repeat-containing protein [Pyrinomonadaceae bacterium]
MKNTDGRRGAGRYLILFLLLGALPLGAVGGLYVLLSKWHRPARRATQAGWAARVATVAGDGSPGARDGAAAGASFGEPYGVAVGPDGSVYVSDAGESNRIRRLTPLGEVLTVAGGRDGFADGAGAAAAFSTPSGLAMDAAGNLYVADTGNNRVRRVTPEGVVATVAGDGAAGFRDGAGAQAQFDAPVGVAVGREGEVYVADTYNDRVRVITKDGSVRTLAGTGTPGHADGGALDAALFDTPCGLAVAEAGEVFVADTGNNRLRKITKDGQVSTLNLYAPPDPAPAANAGAANAHVIDVTTTGDAGASITPAPPPASAAPFELSRPVGLALTRDGFLYVTELDRGRVVQVAPDGAARVIAGRGPGFADGDGRTSARFNQPAGIALAEDGSLVVADAANYLVRHVTRAQAPGDEARERGGLLSSLSSSEAEREGVAPALPTREGVLPRIDVASLGASFPWPLDPQDRWHEMAATMGEVRGSYGTDDSRHHLHSGVDVFGVLGQTVRAVREEKVSSPLANWGFGGLNEGVRAGLMTYVHLRVGRDGRDEMLGGVTPFVAVRDAEGKVERVRLRRGTRLRVGDALGTINRMYHVHMNLGPAGAELNPLALPFPGFTDAAAPKIEPDGVWLFDEAGARVNEKKGGRPRLRGKVRIVVDAFDQVDGNQARRRLGLYRLGYQLLTPDGHPAPGFERVRVNIEFNRLPPGDEPTKIAYADESGITVYGSARTRFLYELTNTVRDGLAARGSWDTGELPPGDYTLRIVAGDFHGNESTHDLPVTLVRE